MIYLERRPSPLLRPFVRTLWYSSAPGIEHGRQRVLPGGCVHVILNLKRDHLWDCPEDEAPRQIAAAQVVGARSIYEIIDNRDLEEMVGVLFEPGGFAPFARSSVHGFSNRFLPLEDLWGGAVGALRDRLRELATAEQKLALLEGFFEQRLHAAPAGKRGLRNLTVELALASFVGAPRAATVSEVARQAGLSERRFSQIFREQVGFSPKVWCRIQRFQRVLRQLYRGAEIPWAELALECGYYDQSHFANEFRAFSGIDATAYQARRTQWANHVDVK